MLLTKQIAVFLSNHGIGRFEEGGSGGNIFINSMPSAPNEAIAIFATGGPEIDRRNEYAGRAIQVLIRTVPNDPRPGETMSQAVIDLLKGFNGGYLAAGGNYIVDIAAQQDGPNNIGTDENGRYEFSQNFIVEMVKSETPVEAPEPTPDDGSADPAPEPINTQSAYKPINVSATRVSDGEFKIRWELPGDTPPDLSSFYVFVNDILSVSMGPSDREFITVLDQSRTNRVYIAAIVDAPYKEYYSDAITI